jgi:4-carboxymuconolactone decarboxylase
MDVLCNRATDTESSNLRLGASAGGRAQPLPDVAELVAGFFDGRRGANRGCDLKISALAALAALTALRAPAPALRAHVRSAIGEGVSREEILTTVTDAALYSGFAAAHAGIKAALYVFAEAEPARTATT